jgi:hypothetical protein
MNNLDKTPNCNYMPNKIIRPRTRFHISCNFQNTAVIVSFHRIKLLVFRRVRYIAKRDLLNFVTFVCLSVLLSVCPPFHIEQLGSYWGIFMKLDI